MVVIQKDPPLLCFSPEGTNDRPHLIHSFSTQYKEFLNEKHTEYREKKKKILSNSKHRILEISQERSYLELLLKERFRLGGSGLGFCAATLKALRHYSSWS